MTSPSDPAHGAIGALPEDAHKKTNRRPEAVLVLVTMIWGVTFLAVQQALRWSEPFTFVGLRFGVAALVLGCLLRRRLAGLTATEVRAGALIGIALFLGYALQTLGLKSIPSSKSAFLTAIYVPLVPLMQWVFLRRNPHVWAWVGIACAFAGTVLLASPQGLSWDMGRGEWLTIGGALAIALEIILVSRYAASCSPSRLAVMQLVAVSVFAFSAAWISGESPPTPSLPLLGILAGLAAATAFIQFAMNWAQKTVSATRATLIYALEPVWGGVVGRLAGERLGPAELLGGLMIVSSVMLGECRWVPRRWRAGRARAKPASSSSF